MRTALITGLIAGAAFALINYGHLASNADFVYMCAAAELLKRGVLLATPYFPPGYPLVLWGVCHTGLTPLDAGVLLSALGMGLSAGALAYVARLWRVAPVAACGLGLLGVSLPDVFQIGCNPHLDAMYTGIGAVLLAVALRCFNSRAHAGLAIAAMLCAILLIGFRYHAVLLVAPVAILLACYRQTRVAGICALIAMAGALGYVYWALHVCTGSFTTAALTQVATGATYRAHGQEAALNIFNDYAAWMHSHPPVTFQTMLDGVLSNWPQFLTRKAVLLGGGLWLLAVLVRRRAAAGSIWLLPLIAGYTLAISTSYFTPRASALTEIAALMLGAGGLSQLFFNGVQSARGKRNRGSASRVWLDPAVASAVLALLLLAGIGYNGYREYSLVLHWRAQYHDALAASQAAARTVGGQRKLVYGSLDHCMWPVSPDSLPGAVYSRWWMDDPAVSPAVEKLIPKYSPDDVVAGRTPVRAILLWQEVRYDHELRLAALVAASPGLWRETGSGTLKARLFVKN